MGQPLLYLSLSATTPAWSGDYTQTGFETISLQMNDHTACGLGGRQYGTSQEIETLQGQGHRGGQSTAFRAFGSETQHHTQSHAVQPIAALHTEYSLMNRRLGPFWVAIILNGRSDAAVQSDGQTGRLSRTIAGIINRKFRGSLAGRIRPAMNCSVCPTFANQACTSAFTALIRHCRASA